MNSKYSKYKNFQQISPDQIRSNPQNYVQMLVRHLDRIGESHKLMGNKNLSKSEVYALYIKVRFFHALTIPHIPEGSDIEAEINKAVVGLDKLNDPNLKYSMVDEIFKWFEKLLRQWSAELMPPKYISIKMGTPENVK